MNSEEQKTEETPAEETKTEEKVETVEEKTEEKAEEKTSPKKEMLTQEVLNSTEGSSQVSITCQDEWQKLKGKELLAWAVAHPFAC